MRLVDLAGVEVLDFAECRRLLGSREVGRLGLIDGGQPVILPLNYLLAGDTIVMRTGPGTKFRHGDGSPVCFEVDEIDPSTQSGWSVLASGRLEEITQFDDPGVQGIRTLPLAPWAVGDRSHWMRLVIRQLTGRRVGQVRSLT